MGNVPLNDLLARFDISIATSKDISAMRLTFENQWNSFHFIRTTSAMISFALTIISLILQN